MIVYKVLRVYKDRLYSAWINTDAMVEYEVGKKIKAKVKRSPLLAFNALEPSIDFGEKIKGRRSIPGLHCSNPFGQVALVIYKAEATLHRKCNKVNRVLPGMCDLNVIHIRHYVEEIDSLSTGSLLRGITANNKPIFGTVLCSSITLLEEIKNV